MANPAKSGVLERRNGRSLPSRTLARRGSLPIGPARRMGRIGAKAVSAGRIVAGKSTATMRLLEPDPCPAAGGKKTGPRGRAPGRLTGLAARQYV